MTEPASSAIVVSGPTTMRRLDANTAYATIAPSAAYRPACGATPASSA